VAEVSTVAKGGANEREIINIVDLLLTNGLVI